MKCFFRLMFLLCLAVSTLHISLAHADEASLRSDLTKVLGDRSSWTPTLLSQLKAGMTCDQARSVFATLGTCDSSKDYDFPQITLENDPVVSSIQLVFAKGALTGADIVFKSDLDGSFKTVSAELFQAKWGEVPVEKKDQDILTKIGPGFVKAQRANIGGQWRISFDFPKQ